MQIANLGSRVDGVLDSTSPFAICIFQSLLQNLPTGRLGCFHFLPTHNLPGDTSEYPNRQGGDLSVSAYTIGRRARLRVPQPAGCGNVVDFVRLCRLMCGGALSHRSDDLSPATAPPERDYRIVAVAPRAA